jgi:acyl dehydratase
VSPVEVAPGDTRELQLVDDLSRTQIVMYAGVSGDYNPLHSDEKYSREVANYPGVFAHGMLTMGMTARVVTEWFGVERVTGYGVRFVRQVWPGDTLAARATVDRVWDDDGGRFAEETVETVNQDDVVVLAGSATVRLDS